MASRRGRRARPDLASQLRRVEARLERRLARLETFTDVARAAGAALDPRGVAEALALRLGEWIPAAVWTVAVGESARPDARVCCRALSPEMEAAVEVVAERVMQTGHSFFSADLRGDARLAVNVDGSVVGFPLLAPARVVGAAIGVHPLPAARAPRLSKRVMRALAAVLELPATALDCALRVRRLEALSVTDDLTQLHNARHLGVVLRLETKRAARTGRPLSLVFVDLDDFKRVNDQHGHVIGSRTLTEVAAVVRSGGRETDLVARYGGDEFALLLPETGVEGAVAVAQRVRDRIAGRAFLAGEGLDIRVTASAGIAMFPEAARTSEELMQAADQAMYWVKAHGKNGVHVAAP